MKLKISKLSIYDLFSLFLIWLRVLAELQMVRCITALNSGCNITIGHKLTGQSAQIQFVQKILLADLHIAGAALLIVMRTVLSHRLADWQGS